MTKLWSLHEEKGKHVDKLKHFNLITSMKSMGVQQQIMLVLQKLEKSIFCVFRYLPRKMFPTSHQYTYGQWKMVNAKFNEYFSCTLFTTFTPL